MGPRQGSLCALQGYSGKNSCQSRCRRWNKRKPHAQPLLEFPRESKARQGRQFRTDDPEEFLGALSSRVGLQMPGDFFWDDLGQGSDWLGVSVFRPGKSWEYRLRMS